MRDTSTIDKLQSKVKGESKRKLTWGDQLDNLKEVFGERVDRSW